MKAANCIASHFGIFSLALSQQISDPIFRDYIILLLEYLKTNKINQRKLVWSLTNDVSLNTRFNHIQHLLTCPML
jgi:hypothetical protein